MDRARGSAGCALVADIGGTNARFGCVLQPSASVAHVRTLQVSDHPGVAQAARAYLRALASDIGVAPPTEAAFAVATVTGSDRVSLTNGPWSFSISAVQRELGLQTLLVLNDFEALALSLPRLGPHQFRPWGEAPRAQGVLAVVGPGTGLGVAGVVETAHGWVALSGEGGHATLAPSDAFESELLALVRREFGHVSAERLLSGTGLPVLHRAVAGVLGRAAEPSSAPSIIERGLGAEDEVCSRTLDAFCAMLGGFCGGVALTLGARGGLYIGGGIVPRLGERFFQSRFRECFVAKGRLGAYLEGIPCALITDTLAALSGAALAIEQHRG